MTREATPDGLRGALGAVATGAGLAATGLAFDVAPLLVAGLTIASGAVLAVVWLRLAARALRVERRLSAHRVVEGAPLEAELVVRAGRLRLPPGTIEDALLPAAAALPAGRRVARVRTTSRFPRRGACRLDAPRIVVRDPFGLAARAVSPGEPAEVLVLPSVHPVDEAAPTGDALGLGLPRRGGVDGAEIELDGIRPLRDGTSASRIHWPSIARRAEPQERVLVAEGDGAPLVVLDPGAADGDGEAALDAAVRATASLVVHLAGRGGCDVLLPGDRRPVSVDASFGAWPRIHARLALVAAGDEPASPGIGARRGPVIYVSGRPLAHAPRALRAGTGVRVLVLPGGEGPGRPLFSVAGCRGFTIGGRAATRPTGSRREVA